MAPGRQNVLNNVFSTFLTRLLFRNESSLLLVGRRRYIEEAPGHGSSWRIRDEPGNPGLDIKLRYIVVSLDMNNLDNSIAHEEHIDELYNLILNFVPAIKIIPKYPHP